MDSMTFEQVHTWAMEEFKDDYQSLPNHQTLCFEEIPCFPIGDMADSIGMKLRIGPYKRYGCNPSRVTVYATIVGKDEQIVEYVSERLPNLDLTLWFPVTVPALGNHFPQIDNANEIEALVLYYFLAAGHLSSVRLDSNYSRDFEDVDFRTDFKEACQSVRNKNSLRLPSNSDRLKKRKMEATQEVAGLTRMVKQESIASKQTTAGQSIKPGQEFRIQLKQLGKHYADLEKENKRLKTENDRLDKSCKALERDAMRSKDVLTTKDNVIESLRSDITSLQVVNCEFGNQKEDQKNRIQGLENMNGGLQTKVATLESQCADLKEEHDVAVNLVAHLKRELQQWVKSHEDHDNEVKQLNKKVEKSQKEKVELKAKLIAAEDKLKGISNLLKGYQHDGPSAEARGGRVSEKWQFGRYKHLRKEHHIKPKV